MSDTVVGRWILENKEKYFSDSLSLPEKKSNDIQEIIHYGWKEEDSKTVQNELKNALIKAYPNAKKGGQTGEEAGFQEAMRCAGSVIHQKYGDSFWLVGLSWRDTKWRIIENLVQVEKCMQNKLDNKNQDLVSKHGLEGLFGGLHRRRKTKKSKRGGKKRKTTRKH